MTIINGIITNRKPFSKHIVLLKIPSLQPLAFCTINNNLSLVSQSLDANTVVVTRALSSGNTNDIK